MVHLTRSLRESPLFSFNLASNSALRRGDVSHYSPDANARENEKPRVFSNGSDESGDPKLKAQALNESVDFSTTSEHNIERKEETEWSRW